MISIRKIVHLCLLLLIAPFIKSQTEGLEVRNKIQFAIPDLNLENKILFINVWQSGDFLSRQNNKEFLRVSEIYKGAKLKNGLKGVCYINISLDNDNTIWEISLKKDSVMSHNSFNTDSKRFDEVLKYFGNKTGSRIVNSNGEIVSKDVKKENCFNLFRSLITR